MLKENQLKLSQIRVLAVLKLLASAFCHLELILSGARGSEGKTETPEPEEAMIMLSVNQASRIYIAPLQCVPDFHL